MTAAEALQKIKALFAEVPAPPVEPAPPAPPMDPPVEGPKDYTLADGSTVQIDKLDIGGLVTTLVDGVAVPVPEGVLSLMDGQSITVDASGAIVSLAPAPVPEDVFKKQLDEMQSQIDEMRRNHTTALEEQESKFNTAIEGHYRKIVAIKDLVFELAKAPIEPPIEKKKAYETKDEKLKRFHEATKKI
jgi:hypothetical protein